MISRKKILYIQKPPGGGSLIALYELIRVLNKTKYEPIILCYEQNEYTQILETLEAKVIFFSKPLKLNSKKKNLPQKTKQITKLAYKFKKFFVDDVTFAKRIKQVIIEQKIDLIHHNCDFPFIRQGLLANTLKLPQVCHYRSLQPYQKFTFDWMIDKWLVRKVDYHICISNAVQMHFAKYLNIPVSNTTVLRDIIDVEKFRKKMPDKMLMKRLNLSEEDIIVTSIGRILPWKGQHVFIEAFSEVAKKKPHVKALIVGPHEDGLGNYDYYVSLKQQAVELGLEDRILFTGNRDDIPELIAISHCIVHSSISPEPQGLVIVEALFCNTPVVVSDSGGSAELIVNNEGGMKFISGNASSMASAICGVLDNQIWFAKMQEKPKILQDFIPEKQIEVIENIYDELLFSKN